MATLLKESNFTNSNNFKIRLEYSYTQDIPNNRTTITYYNYFVSMNSYSGSGSASTGYINNTNIGSTTSLGKNEKKLLGSLSVTVNHNSDGTFPSTAYSASITSPWGGIGSASVSGNLTGLPTIPRASTPTLSSNNFNIGSSTTLTTNRKSTSFTHTVVLSFGSYSKTYTNVGDSLVIDTSSFASNMYAQIPNAKSGTGTITTTTYSGSTQIGSSSSLTFTANAIEGNVNPQISAITYSVDSTTSSLANGTTFIKGVTTAIINVTANRRMSATLTKVFLWYYNGTNKVVLSSQNVNADGTYSFTINGISVSKVYGGATDTRGYTTYNTAIDNVPTTFKDYVTLTADTNATIKRIVQTEPNVRIDSFTGNYWNDSFRSGNANTLTIQWRYKETTASSYSAYYTIPSGSISISNNKYTISNYTLTNGSTTELFNYQKSYHIQISVTDKVGTKTALYTITSGQPNFAIFPNGNVTNGGKLALKGKSLFYREYGNYGSDTYFLLARLPVTGNANGSTIRIEGSIGEYMSEDKATIDVIIGSRNSLTHYGTYTGNLTAFNHEQIVVYTQSDNSYNIYFKFLAGYHGGVRLEVSGTNALSVDVETSPATPTGTLSKTINYTSLANLDALPFGKVNTLITSGRLVTKKASASIDTGVLNNGIVLEYSNSANWGGQLWLGDNANAGIAWNGWSNGERGTWKKFVWEGATENYSANEEKIGSWASGKNIYRKTITTTKANLISSINSISNRFIRKIDGFMQASNNVWMPINNWYGDTTFCWTLWNNADGTVAGSFGSKFTDSSACFVTIEYTKTNE